MLISKVSIQLLCVFGLIVAELAFVRFQFIVLLYVLLQALVAGAGEGTLVTAENHSLQVLGQLGTAHLDGNDPLLCGDSTTLTEQRQQNHPAPLNPQKPQMHESSVTGDGVKRMGMERFWAK